MFFLKFSPGLWHKPSAPVSHRDHRVHRENQIELPTHSTHWFGPAFSVYSVPSVANCFV
ncbi:hypothetical protein SFMTTN_2111 [Sulfuriferula multivorans]|uniref:Uncharacterized protein n=1 Tax=Sulfuriferula multivorans TaxID=1559896 RepID=A0A401JFB8_9PROT|nr:hypothetical protein SFMTTN_2111 [Sulfuriferula multivorans]